MTIDLRSPEKHKELLREYYASANLLEQDLTKLDDLVDRSLSEIAQSDKDLRNVRWAINSLKFDNKDKEKPESLVVNLAGRMHKYPI